MRGLFLVRSPARALKRCVSSALRPRVDTISPFSRNASETEIAWSSNPPGLLRRSTIKPLSLSPAWAPRSVIAFFSPSVVCSLNCVTRIKPTSSPSRRERTERTWMRARVLVNFTGLSWPLSMIMCLFLEFYLGFLMSSHFLYCLFEGQPLHRLVVEMGDDVVGHDAGLGRRGVVDRRHDLDQAVLHGHFDAEAAELAAGLYLHVAEALGIHVARMRIEPGQHAVDRRFDELAVVGLFHIVRPHSLDHITE